MTENVLFLIHGVGDHGIGWSNDVQGFLKEEIKKYPTFENEDKPMDGRLHFEEIVYNDVLDNILGGWEQLTQQFSAVDDEFIPGILDTVNGFIGPMAANGSHLRNNNRVKRAADVLLYRGLTLVQRLVLLKIVSQIASVITAKRQASGNQVKFGVLGHSLGTAVAHDAMQVMATTNWLRTGTNKLRTFKDISAAEVEAADNTLGSSPLGTGNFRFKSVYMVSNTSPLLYTTKSPYKSVVRPPFGRIAGNTDKYVNINHKFDPVDKVRPMDISKWPKAKMLSTAIDLRPQHVHQLNVHDLQHYLADPQIHGHLFLDLVDDFTRDDYAFALLRRDPQDNLVKHPFPKYKGNFDRREVRDQLENHVKMDLLEKLLAALSLLNKKIPALDNA
jgi:hypothetical protein